MCLGIPGELLEIVDPGSEFPTGIVEFGGVCRRVNLACVPESQIGDYVIVHAGIAISRIDAEEANKVRQTIDAMADLDGWDESVPHPGES